MAIPGFQDLDFHAFHREELPRRLADGRGASAAAAVRSLGGLAFRLPGGDAYTYLPGPDGMEVAPGEERAETVIEIGQEDWEGIVHDYESAPGLLYGARVRCRRGDAMRFVLWEPGLRAIFSGRPVYDPARLRLEDRAGRPLDPEQTFPPGSDPEDLAHFLRTTGYLLLRGVFGAEEVAGWLEEARELRAEAVKGDQLSWWGRNARQEEVLCRVTRGADKPRLAALRRDPRIRRLADLADEPLVPRDGEGNGVALIYKNPDMAEGLSDLPWHRDCGMGGHAVMCPVLLVSVFLTPASPETGELRFLPGSWRASAGFREATDPRAPRGVGFAARPGDVSVHYGDVMHAAPPPAGSGLDAYRISAVMGFSRPDARQHRGEKSYNQVLHQRPDGQIEHLARVVERA